MGLKKGQTNNPNGRPKGVPNKVTADLKKFVVTLLERNQRQIMKDLAEADGATRLRFFTSLLPYVIPKQTQAQITSIDKLTEGQMNQIISEITKDVD